MRNFFDWPEDVDVETLTEEQREALIETALGYRDKGRKPAQEYPTLSDRQTERRGKNLPEVLLGKNAHRLTGFRSPATGLLKARPVRRK